MNEPNEICSPPKHTLEIRPRVWKSTDFVVVNSYNYINWEKMSILWLIKISLTWVLREQIKILYWQSVLTWYLFPKRNLNGSELFVSQDGISN